MARIGNNDPPNKLHPSLHVLILPSIFHTFKYPSTHSVPSELYTSDRYTFVSVTKTSDELSLVLGYKDDPQATSAAVREKSLDDGDAEAEGEEDLPAVNRVEEMGEHLAGRWTGPWRCLKVRGPMYLNMVGIMNELSKPLRSASVAIFAISTWNTDYVLVPARKILLAEKALESDGWTVIHVKQDAARYNLTHENLDMWA